MQESRQTVRALYRGHVQGVGFRWTTCRIARRFLIAGTVQNLPDGSVEVIAQGAPSEIAAFREALEQAMSGHIKDVELSELDSSEQLSGFGICH